MALLAAAAGVAPNDDSAFPAPTPATLHITGDLFLGAELNIDVAGATATADAVAVGGAATLGGLLSIDVHSPYASPGLTSHTVLTAGGGVVGALALPAPLTYLGHGVRFDSAAIGPNDVTISLVQSIYADFDDDLDVDGVDFTIWKSGYAVGTTHAQGDADLDDDVDGGDFLVWQRQHGTIFAAPPISGLPTAVPEPATWWLAVLAGLAARGRRRSTASRRP